MPLTGKTYTEIRAHYAPHKSLTRSMCWILNRMGRWNGRMTAGIGSNGISMRGRGAWPVCESAPR